MEHYYYQVLEMDLRGNVTRSRQGNGITTERSYYSATGRLRTQRADLFNGLFGELQDKEYEWDELGNLIHRYDYHGEEPVQEDFGYDELNRLKWSKVSGREQVNVDYDALGNISKKSDVGSYSYGAECDKSAGPHALCKTSDGTSYWYDANGSMVGDSSGRTIEYSSFDKPTKISKGGHTTRFAYSPSRSRYLRTDESAQGATTLTRYLGNVERITHPGGRLEIKRRLPGGALISYTRSADGQPAGKTTHYLHMDHLGSIDIISNEIGQLVARMSFDPWGQRRDPLNWGPLVDKALSELETNITGITKRGFTGHEMLDEVGLIHMNGRIYDPRLGRFLQADPLIDGVTDTQGYNRYSYVHNNPLNATDPSGFSAWTRFRDNFLKPVVQAIVTFHCIPCGTALAAATTAYYGGDAFDVAVSAFSTYVMASMGKGFAASGGGFSGGEAFVFGVTGGITSTLRGGKFGHGFVSAYTGAVTGGFVQGLDNAAAELIASSVIAGSISEATGGKFANGAAYGAFSWAVAQGAQGLSDRPGEPDNITNEIVDTGLDLYVEDGVVKGDVVLKCLAGGGASCGSAVEAMKNINRRANIDLNISLASEGEAYDIGLKIGDRFTGFTENAGLYRPVSGGPIVRRIATFFGQRPTIYLSPSRMGPLTPLHEFGHALGLGHQKNSTNSVMSYNFGERASGLQDAEVDRLIEFYSQ